jgi:AraC-like DNA-binding protein
MDDRIRAMVAEGLTLEAMARELGVDRSTVTRRMRRLGLETAQMARRRAFREARAHGQTVAFADCERHGRVRYVLSERDDGFRCVQCQVETVSDARRRRKAELVAEAGGRCQLCGYARCIAALHFHHVDPTAKRFAVSYRGLTRSRAALRAEAAKCVLLCANCHAEVETGVRRVA